MTRRFQQEPKSGFSMNVAVAAACVLAASLAVCVPLTIILWLSLTAAKTENQISICSVQNATPKKQDRMLQ